MLVIVTSSLEQNEKGKRKKENEPETALLYLLLSCLQHRLERRKTLVPNLWQNSSAVWAKKSLEIGN